MKGKKENTPKTERLAVYTALLALLQEQYKSDSNIIHRKYWRGLMSDLRGGNKDNPSTETDPALELAFDMVFPEGKETGEMCKCRKCGRTGVSVLHVISCPEGKEPPREESEEIVKEIEDWVFAECPTEKEEPFFWRWTNYGKKELANFISSLLSKKEKETEERKDREFTKDLRILFRRVRDNGDNILNLIIKYSND